MTEIEVGQTFEDAMFDTEVEVVEITDENVIVRTDYVENYFASGKTIECDSWYPHEVWDRNVAAGRFKPENGDNGFINVGSLEEDEEVDEKSDSPEGGTTESDISDGEKGEVVNHDGNEAGNEGVQTPLFDSDVEDDEGMDPLQW